MQQHQQQFQKIDLKFVRQHQQHMQLFPDDQILFLTNDKSKKDFNIYGLPDLVG